MSLAALLLIQVWENVVQVRSPQSLYTAVGPPTPTLEICALISTFLLTVVVFLLLLGMIVVPERNARRGYYALPAALGCFVLWNSGAFLAGVFLLPASQELSRRVFGTAQSEALVVSSVSAILFYSYLLPAALAVLVLWRGRRTWRFVEAVALILLPFGALCIGQTVWQTVFRPTMASGFMRPSAAEPNGPRKPLVLWIMFDEMSQSAAFNGSLGRLDLPNLAALRTASVHAEHACEASNDTTTAIPSYLLGRAVAGVRWDSADDLMLRFTGTDTYVRWTHQRTIFQDATEAGYEAAIVGYYHPYCRLFGDLTTSCEVFAHPEAGELAKWWSTLQAAPLQRALLLQLDHALPGPSPVRRFDGVRFRWWEQEVLRHVERQNEAVLPLFRRAILHALARADLNFVFIHIPLPHPPDLRYFIGSTGARIEEPGYSGNLQAADRLLGEITELLVASGRWDETALVVTSDHSVREFWRRTLFLSPSLLRAIETPGGQVVPFLVKPPHEARPFSYPRPFHAILAHGIVRRLLRGEIRSPEQVVEYLDANAARYPCP